MYVIRTDSETVIHQLLSVPADDSFLVAMLLLTIIESHVARCEHAIVTRRRYCSVFIKAENVAGPTLDTVASAVLTGTCRTSLVCVVWSGCPRIADVAYWASKLEWYFVGEYALYIVLVIVWRAPWCVLTTYFGVGAMQSSGYVRWPHGMSHEVARTDWLASRTYKNKGKKFRWHKLKYVMIARWGEYE